MSENFTSRPKPQAFPMFMDPRFRKEWDLGADAGSFASQYDELIQTEDTVDEELGIVNEFGEVDDDGIETVAKTIKESEEVATTQRAAVSQDVVQGDLTEEYDAVLQQAVSKFESRLSEDERRLFAKIRATREVSRIFEGLGLLPQSVIANSEFTGGSDNFERVDDPTLPNYRTILDGAKTDAQLKLERDILGSEFVKSLEALPGTDNTLPHNLNAFHGLGTNFVKKQDSALHGIIQDSDAFKHIHSTSLSPAQILDESFPGFWESIHKEMQEIQHARVETSNVEVPDDGDGDLNIENTADVYRDNTIDQFDINANFNQFIRTEAWRGFNPKQVFAWMHRYSEVGRRIEGLTRGIFGRSADLPRYVSDEEVEKDETIETKVAFDLEGQDTDVVALLDQDTEGEVQTKQDTIKQRVEDWWQGTGQYMDISMLLPYGMLGSMLPVITGAQDLSNWGAASDEVLSDFKGIGEFRHAMIEGYLSHLNSEYMESFSGNNTVTADDLVVDDTAAAQALLDQLKGAGYLTEDGKITSKVDFSDPNFLSDLELVPAEASRVKAVLRAGSVGSFDLDGYDRATPNSQPRRNIRLQGSDGEYRTLSDVMSLVGKGQTDREKVDNLYVAYDYLMSIHSSMTGLDLNSGPKLGSTLYRQSGSDVVVDIYGKGSWEQWDYDTESFKTVQTDATTLTFASLTEADQFKGQVRQLLELINPMMAFVPKDKPVQKLTDNTGSTSRAQSVTQGDLAYRMQVDVDFKSSILGTKAAKDVVWFLERKVINKVFSHTSGVMFGNEIQVEKHKRDVEEYNEENKEAKEEDARQQRDLKRSQMRHKKQLKKVENEAKQYQKDLAALARKQTEASKKAQAARRKKKS